MSARQPSFAPPVTRVPPALLGLTFVLGAAVPGVAREEEANPEDPQAVVVLRDVGPGEGAPTKEGLSRYVVLSEVGEKDPLYEVVRILLARREGVVVPFKPAKMDGAFQRLKRIAPGAVAVVVRPETLDVHFHFELLERASRLDDDPFVDFTFGYFTGATPEEAVAFAKETAPHPEGEHPRSVLEFGPGSAAPLGPAAPHPWATGFTKRSLSHAEGSKDVAKAIAEARDGAPLGVLSAWGHGDPAGVAQGLQGRDVRESGLDLSGTLYFSGPCFCGVTGRWWEPSGNVTKERDVKPEDSFVLSLIRARVAGAFAGLDPDRGETNHHELEHLLLTGEALGFAAKSTYDQAALAYRRPTFDLPRHSASRPSFRSIHDQMTSGGACRALFGDPAYVPFRKAGQDPFAVRTKATKDGLEVSWTSTGIGPYWMPVDVFRAGGGWTHRILFRLDLPREEAERIRSLRVVSITRDDKPLAHAYPTLALESWGGSVRVHGMAILPTKDVQDRPLWGGRRYEAKFLLGR